MISNAAARGIGSLIPDPLSEHDHQVKIFEWADFAQRFYPELAFMTGSMAGVRLGMPAAMQAKRAGMKKDMPDIFLPAARQGYHGLFIELKPLTRGIKTPRRPAPTKGQRICLEALADLGYYACCRFGYRAAIDTIIKYLEAPRWSESPRIPLKPITSLTNPGK